MKTLFQIILVLLAFSLCVCADDSNGLFETQRETTWAKIGMQTTLDLKQAYEDNAATAERMPAGQDPEGHWGSAVGGIQLGVRSLTNIYSSGDPIIIYAFERNVTTNAVKIPHWGGGVGLILMIEDESGLTQRTPELSDSFLGTFPLAGRSQVKCVFNLPQNYGLHLKPGTYKIHVLHEGFIEYVTKKMVYNTNECSGDLTIKVVGN